MRGSAFTCSPPTLSTRLGEAARTLFPMIAEVPADHDVVIDFYVFHSGRLGATLGSHAAGSAHRAATEAGFPRSIRRIVVTAAGTGHGQGMAGMHFTYRPSRNGYEEEKLYRGIHPMMGKRFHLWRLSNFKIDRLPSVEDVYLIHGVARDNPKDERLFACAEVRDVTPVRDKTGRIVQLPHLERMLTEAIAGIRLFQSRRPPGTSPLEPDILYVWPPFNLGRDELRDIVRKLAPPPKTWGWNR